MTIVQSSLEPVVNRENSSSNYILHSKKNRSTGNSKLAETWRTEEAELLQSSPHFAPSFLSSASDKMMNKSIEKSENMICTSRFVGLLSDSVTKRSSRVESLSYDSSSISSVPSRSSSSRSYYNPSGHWAFGMILIVSIILSTFSTSSMVMCVPLGHQLIGNDEGASSLSPSQSDPQNEGAMIISNSRLLELGQKQRQMEDADSMYSLQNKGQLYLPSLLNNGQVKAAAKALASPTDYSNGGFGMTRGTGLRSEEDQQNSNRHSFSNYKVERLQTAAGSNPSTQNAPPIQKSLPLDLARSLVEERDDFDDEDPADSDIKDDNSDPEQSEWETVIDPHLYVLTEWNTQPYQEQFPLQHQQRKRRNSGTGPSLSIVNPLDVLRQRLLLEIARRRMRQSHNQIIANEEILRKIGRRRR